jgi:hypothetical protein
MREIHRTLLAVHATVARQGVRGVNGRCLVPARKLLGSALQHAFVASERFFYPAAKLRPCPPPPLRSRCEDRRTGSSRAGHPPRTEQASNADAIVDEAAAAGLDGSDPLTVHVKMLRAELLSVKADLERELERVVLDCLVCGRTAHYVGGFGVRAGH